MDSKFPAEYWPDKKIRPNWIITWFFNMETINNSRNVNTLKM